MASISVPCPKIYGRLRSADGSSDPKRYTQSRVSFPRAPKLCLKSCQSGSLKSRVQASEVDSNFAPALEGKSKADSSNGKAKATESRTQDPEALSAFVSQVIDLIRLVDSKDIVELELKQNDSQIVIRKKEALQPTPAAATPAYAMPPLVPQPAPTSTPVAAPAPAPSSSPSPPVKAGAAAVPAKTGQSSHPAMKSPMAGTFYRSPAPGEPPFVKVGDKVKKGQVICIIEAMKLMNEIEADQDGTIADILVEDSKPVSVDTPLVVIAP